MFGPPGHLYVLLHLRHALVRQRRLRDRRRGRRGAAAGRRGGRGRCDARADPAARRATRGDLARGPARLATAASAWTAPRNGVDLCDPASPVRAAPVARRRAGRRTQPARGSGSPWRPSGLWRFWLADEPTVSSFRPGSRGRRPVDPHRHTREPRRWRPRRRTLPPRALRRGATRCSPPARRRSCPRTVWPSGCWPPTARAGRCGSSSASIRPAPS